MLALITKIEDPSILKNTKKALQRLHGNLLFCLENLGLWGALQVSSHCTIDHTCDFVYKP